MMILQQTTRYLNLDGERTHESAIMVDSEE